jgi:hypothetical protein
MAAINISDLSTATVDGAGVFDVLMRANKAHLETEFLQGRIKGPEYSTVYLGALDQAMQTALSFVVQRQRIDLEAQLLAVQISIAGIELQKVNAELAILEASLAKVPVEIAHIEAQTANLASEKLSIEARTALTNQQETNLAAEALNVPKQGALLDAQSAVSTQQRLNLISEELGIDAKTALTTQQEANAVLEGTVLVAQECKLRAEFDLTQATTLKSEAELGLLTQKTATERAQITAMGVDDNSVIGKQKLLYAAQTTGFTRDAEQKAAKLLADTWSVRRTTDEGTVADGTNKLSDTYVGRAIDKLLTGVGA